MKGYVFFVDMAGKHLLALKSVSELVLSLIA